MDVSWSTALNTAKLEVTFCASKTLMKDTNIN